MELTHIYKNNITRTNFRVWFRQFLLAFINEHADVFEALSRQATPFGGNWLTDSRHPGKPKSSKLNREQLTAIQQQLDELSQTVILLSEQIDSGELVAPTDEIGINRFRALRASI